MLKNAILTILTLITTLLVMPAFAEKCYLCKAVAKRDVDFVQRLLDDNVDVNISDENGRTPLMYAIINGDAEIAQILIDAGSDVHLTDNNGDNAMDIVALTGYVCIAKILVAAGLNVPKEYIYSIVNDSNYPYVCGDNKIEPWQLEDCSLCSVVADGDNDDYFDKFQRRLELGANPNETDENGNTALDHALRHGNVRASRILINLNVKINKHNINKKYFSGTTNLGRASIPIFLFNTGDVLGFYSSIGENDIVSFLLGAGLNINKKNDYGNTPLHYAAQSGNANMVAELLLRGADPDIQNNEGKTALMHAIEKGKSIVVALLVLPIDISSESGIDNINELFPGLKLARTYLETEDWKGLTALMHAVMDNRLDITQILLHAGARPNKQLSDGSVALHYAVLAENFDIVKALLSQKAEPDIVFKWNGRVKIVDKPGLFTGDLTIRERYTPEDVAKGRGLIGMQKLLKNAGSSKAEIYQALDNYKDSHKIGEAYTKITAPYILSAKGIVEVVSKLNVTTNGIFSNVAKGLQLLDGKKPKPGIPPKNQPKKTDSPLPNLKGKS